MVLSTHQNPFLAQTKVISTLFYNHLNLLRHYPTKTLPLLLMYSTTQKLATKLRWNQQLRMLRNSLTFSGKCFAITLQPVWVSSTKQWTILTPPTIVTELAVFLYPLKLKTSWWFWVIQPWVLMSGLAVMTCQKEISSSGRRTDLLSLTKQWTWFVRETGLPLTTRIAAVIIWGQRLGLVQTAAVSLSDLFVRSLFTCATNLYRTDWKIQTPQR